MEALTYGHTAISINGREELLAAIVDDAASPKTAFEQHTFQFIRDWISGKTAFTLQTSGSTGLPKSISVTREQMTSSAQLTIQALTLKREYTALICVDTRFIAGKMMLVRSFLAGMRIVAIEPTANPFEDLNGVTIDFCALVPYQLDTVIRSTVAYRLNDIKTIIVGGAPVSSELVAGLSHCRCSVFATYGMTETLSHIALRPLNGTGASDYFQALPGIDIDIDERGCLVAQISFLDEPVYTNDLIALDTPGRFRWLGRVDNVINSGGIKVIPEEIENVVAVVFAEFNLVERFLISSLPDASLGRRIVLVIETKHIESVISENLLLRLKEALPKHHQPKQIIPLFPFLYTSNGKVNRLAVENLLQSPTTP